MPEVIDFSPVTEQLNKFACLNESQVIDITGLSSPVIRKLIKSGDFPLPRQYKNVRRKFWVAGEILNWLKEQQTQEIEK